MKVIFLHFDDIHKITNKTIDSYDLLDALLLEHINIHYKFNYRLVNENIK